MSTFLVSFRLALFLYLLWNPSFFCLSPCDVECVSFFFACMADFYFVVVYKLRFVVSSVASASILLSDQFNEAFVHVIKHVIKLYCYSCQPFPSNNQHTGYVNSQAAPFLPHSNSRLDSKLDINNIDHDTQTYLEFGSSAPNIHYGLTFGLLCVYSCGVLCAHFIFIFQIPGLALGLVFFWLYKQCNLCTFRLCKINH